jgi:hypothetical protein
MMGATTMPIPQIAMAFPRSRGGNVSSMTAWEMGCITPPVAPWTMRQRIRKGSDGERPQRNEATVKRVTESNRSRLRPKWRASHPVIGRITALAAR